MALEHVIWDVKRIEYHKLREQREDIIKTAKNDRNRLWKEKIEPINMGFGYYEFGSCILLEIDDENGFRTYTDSKFNQDAEEVLAKNLRNQIETRVRIMRGLGNEDLIH